MPLGRFIDEDDLTAQRKIDINLHGVILGTKLALARMVPRGRGHIVNIASQAGKYGAPGGATYSATKHAVVGLSEAVRAELRRGPRHRPQLRDAGVVNTELGSGWAGARACTTSSLPRWPMRSSRLSSTRSSTCACPSRPAHHQLGTLLPRSLREGLGTGDEGRPRARPTPTSRARHDYELRAARSEPGLELRPSSRRSRRSPETDEHPSGASCGSSSWSAAEPLGDQPADRGPWSSWRKCQASSIRAAARRPIAAAKLSPTAAGGRGRSRPTTSASAARPRAAPRARAGPAAAPGASGVWGIISGKARAPAFEATFGNGAS